MLFPFTDFLDFWMKSVHTLLAQQKTDRNQTLLPPVIIVCTKTDLLNKVGFWIDANSAVLSATLD